MENDVGFVQSSADVYLILHKILTEIFRAKKSISKKNFCNI